MLLLSLLCLFGTACKDDVYQYVFEARIVDADNGNPAAGTDATLLRIGIQEGELDAAEYEYPITDGQFDASLQFRSFSSLTRVRVEIEGPTSKLLTAPPQFIPSVSGGFMRVVATPPSSCELIAFNQMAAPRARFGMVSSGTFSLVIGGTGASEEQVEYFDELQWDSRLFVEDLALSDLGGTRAASIDEAEILVLPDDPNDAAPFIFNMQDASQRITPLALYTGAGAKSAIVSVPGLGAMVIGGEIAGEPLTEVRLIGPGGEISSYQLREARSGPGATALGADVLIVGGDATGSAEILFRGVSIGQLVPGVADGRREDGVLVGDGDSRALWMGGTDGASAIRQDTVQFEGCPESCVSSAGPAWTEARLDLVQPSGSGLLIGGENSPRVEEVSWAGGAVAIQPLLSLNVARARAGAIVLESGAVVVAGGDDGADLRDDFEFCVPATLEPL